MLVLAPSAEPLDALLSPALGPEKFRLDVISLVDENYPPLLKGDFIDPESLLPGGLPPQVSEGQVSFRAARRSHLPSLPTLQGQALLQL